MDKIIIFETLKIAVKMSIQIENEINSLFEEIETLCSQHTEVNPLITELTDIPIVKKVRAPRRPKEVIQAEKEAKALKAGAKLQAKTAEETYKAMRVPSQWFQVTDSDLLNEHLGEGLGNKLQFCRDKIRERGGFLNCFAVTYSQKALTYSQLIFIDAYDNRNCPWIVVHFENLSNLGEWSTFLCLNHTGDNGGMTPFPLENIENNGKIKHWIGNFDRLEDKQKYRAMVIQDDDGVLLK